MHFMILPATRPIPEPECETVAVAPPVLANISLPVDALVVVESTKAPRFPARLYNVQTNCHPVRFDTCSDP